MVGKGHHQEEAGEHGQQKEVILLRVVEGDLMNDVEPAQPHPFAPTAEAGEWASHDPMKGTHSQPELPLGYRWSQEQLP